MTRITEQDLLQRMDQFHAEVVDFANKFATSTQTLNDAVKTVNESKNTWFVVYKAPITVAITLIAIAIAVAILAFGMKATNTCIVNVGDGGKNIAIRSCSQFNSKQ